MYILLLFAFAAGIVTVISPCILPVLPLLLAAGAAQGRYRPYGIIVGLVVSFTFFTLSLTALVHLTGISPDFLRYIAIALITFFGLTLIFPQLEQWFSQLTSGIANVGQQFQAQTITQESGFWSGFILGCALGLVWTPCAGPILAAITTLVATSAISWSIVLITIAYSLGTAVPMFLIIWGGSTITNSLTFIAPYTQIVRTIFGILMILGAAAIAFHADVALQQLTARYFPTISIEENSLVKKELEEFMKQSNGTSSAVPTIGAKAPEFIGIVDWINTRPLTMQQLHGKVVLVDFWTYSCINCVRTLPYLKQWYDTYKDKGFVIVGVHTPEFEFEKNIDNVKDAAKRFNLQYPIALDSNYSTWRNYHNRYWPAHYLIDQNGIIREIHFGEGEYEKTENAIRTLLGMGPTTEYKKEQIPVMLGITPETYLGYARAQSYMPQLSLKNKETATYDYRGQPEVNQVGLKGTWFISEEFIQSQSDDATLQLNFLANRVYAVMASEKPALITVLLDGKPLPNRYYTTDMNANGQIAAHESRMYDVVNLKGDGGLHILTLQVPKNASIYVFTFGNEL
jgi:cytochrome c biogenesis protein CcdA/thiol-disulfide isomerase/thioredoxin